MEYEIRQVGPDSLEQYKQIPMEHRVETVFRVDEVDGGFGGLSLTETPFDKPYVKKFDENPEEGVSSWLHRFNVKHWLFLLACDAEKAVGGATLAFRTPEVHMLQGRNDLAVLWDIRVHPEYKGKGIGTKLLDYAATWARQQGCTQIKIETQNNNVPACRFYASRGCRLGAIDRYAYSHDPRFANETMLIWYLDL